MIINAGLIIVLADVHFAMAAPTTLPMILDFLSTGSAIDSIVSFADS